MKKKGTGDDRTRYIENPLELEEDDPFEFIDEEEENKRIGRQRKKMFVEERKKKPSAAVSYPEKKSDKQSRGQIVFFQSVVIVVLAAILIISAFFQSRNMKRVMQAIADLTEQGDTLNGELMKLNQDIQNLESFQESYLAANSEETLLTYDSDGNEVRIPILPNVPKHPYDWTCLQSLYGRKNYIVDGQRVSKQGVDVSSFQGEIDWQKVKADGIEFAIIRLGYRGYGTGRMMLDDYYEANIQGALDSGLEVGVYFFSQAISEEEAIEEAQVVLENIRKYNVTYPIIYDAEEIPSDTARTDGLTVRQLTDNAIAFCKYIEAAGYSSMIYSNKRWLLTKLDLERLIDYDIWFAGYINIPEYPYDFKIWQYTESGSVDGINGNVDLNISFMDYRSQ